MSVRITRLFWLVLAAYYAVLLWRLWGNALLVDFPSFYVASQTLVADHNPYKALFATYMAEPKQLNFNLNPPILLLLFHPLTWFSYPVAFWLWFVLSFLMGLGTMTLMCKLVFPPDIFKRNWGYGFLFYLAFFPTLINVWIAQLGTAIALCIMLGYYCYVQGRYLWSGLAWGVVIATKLFPALLFLFVLKMRCYRLFWIMVSVVAVLSLIPVALYGVDIYAKYFSILPRVRWYGDNWNASLYGFLFRWWVKPEIGLAPAVWVDAVHTVLLALGVLVYLKIKEPTDQAKTHAAFCMMIVMMLFFSPFAWVYFLPLLLFPLMVLYWRLLQSPQASYWLMMGWLVSLFLLNFPIDHVAPMEMGSNFTKMTLFSCPFYGLVLLGYLGYRTSRESWAQDVPAPLKQPSILVVHSVDNAMLKASVLPMVLILSLGVFSLGCRLTNVIGGG